MVELQSKDKRKEEVTCSRQGCERSRSIGSRRSRDSSSQVRARQHRISSLAAELRQITVEPSRVSDAEISKDDRKRFNSTFHHYRFIVVMMGGVSVAIMLLMRLGITVAIQVMVNQTAIYMKEHPDRTPDDFLAEGYSPGGKFDWDNETQNMIISWYMIAYTLPQVFTTKIGLKLGLRLTMAISLAICAISTLLIPSFSSLGWQYVIVLRLINGVGASAVIPMMLDLVENWMPCNQIALGLTCAQLVSSLISTTIPVISGTLAQIHWSWAFYIPATAALVFCCIWLIIVTDRPAGNRLMSQREVDLIRMPASSEATTAEGKNPKIEKTEVSLARVLRVPSFYCFMLIWCFQCVAYSSFNFILPAYLRQFKKVTISQNGFYGTIIQAGNILSVIWPHLFLRWIQEGLNFSETVARRTTEAIICLVTAITWTYVGFFNNLQIPLLFINRTFHGANDIVVTSTLMSNYAHAGLSSMVFSLVNTVGNLVIVFVSTFIGWFLDYMGQSEACWACIYCALALSQILLGLIFVTTISAGPIDLSTPELMTQTSDEYTGVPVVGKGTDVSVNNFEKSQED